MPGGYASPMDNLLKYILASCVAHTGYVQSMSCTWRNSLCGV